MSVAYTLAGGYVSINGVNYDGITHQGPRRVEYQGPTMQRRVSGAPFYQGPATFILKWPVCDLDTFQSIYVTWNLNVNNIPDGPLVDFGRSDPRNAGAFVTSGYFMDEPQFAMEELYVRDVTVTLTEAIDR